MCEAIRLDYILFSAIVSGLIFLIVLKIGWRVAIMQNAIMQIEEIVITFNNIIANAVGIMDVKDLDDMVKDMKQERDVQENIEAINEWDNS
tara:strand:- start:535 stop:807 length:273 start_codon:yes stop_codon:yes gene_type:complete